MNKTIYQIAQKVVRDYMKVLTVEECRQWVMDHDLTNRNTKLLKGSNYNVGLELLPATLSGANLCAGAGRCRYSCLAFAGIGNVLNYKSLYTGGMPAPLRAKAIRTFLFLNDKGFFFDRLEMELKVASLYAGAQGSQLAVRLNVTSDVDFSHFIKENPFIQFYSYTKIWDMPILKNHHITFSGSEKTSVAMITSKLEAGCNVALIFRNKVPSSWKGFKVIDGDINDDRYNDESGVVVGLKLKNTMGVREAEPYMFD